MTKRAMTAAVLLSAAFAAAACDKGGTGTGPGERGLTASEAAALNRAVLGIGTGMAAGSAPRSNRAAAADGSGSFTFGINTTHPCSPSGSAAVAGTISGSWNQAAQTGQLQSAFGVTHNACAVPTEAGIIRLTGDPKIDVTLQATSNASGLATLRITEKGAFTWDRGNGNSGRCTVDVAAELVPGTQQIALRGTFCGFAVNGTVEDIES